MKEYVFPLALLIVAISCTREWEHESTAIAETFLGEIDWVKNYGGTGEETAQAIIKTTDGGYAVLGYSNSIDGDLQEKTIEVNDYWVLKLDAVGVVQWDEDVWRQ